VEGRVVQESMYVAKKKISSSTSYFFERRKLWNTALPDKMCKKTTYIDKVVYLARICSVEDVNLLSRLHSKFLSCSLRRDVIGLGFIQR
jgi:hypothetical protein